MKSPVLADRPAAVHFPVARHFSNIVHYIAAAHLSRLPRRSEHGGWMSNRSHNSRESRGPWVRFVISRDGRRSWVRFVISRDPRRPWVRFVVSRNGWRPWVRFVISWRTPRLQRSVYEISEIGLGGLSVAIRPSIRQCYGR